jgi:hypothetical protein
MEMSKFELTSSKVLLDDEKEIEKSFAIVDSGIFGRFVYTIATSSITVVVVEYLRSQYLLKYHDVMFFTLHALHGAIRRYKKEAAKSPNSVITTGALCTNILAIVDKLSLLILPEPENPEENEMDGDDNLDVYYFYSSNETEEKQDKLMSGLLKSEDEFKKVYSKFWLEFLLLSDIPRPIYQIVLLRMDDHIIPNFDNPLILNDFIQSSFDKGKFHTVTSYTSYSLLSIYRWFYRITFCEEFIYSNYKIQYGLSKLL